MLFNIVVQTLLFCVSAGQRDVLLLGVGCHDERDPMGILVVGDAAFCLC